MTLTHGSLFSGRGGFDIGAEWAGIETKWNCENDLWLRHKLKRIHPHAKQYEDVTTTIYPPYVDIISAGFPCQDISIANQKNKQGIRGSRSGLWTEVARIASEIKPRYLLLENSPELLRNGFEYILSDLSEIGYDAEWDCWTAKDFGYPHRRKRLYVIAYAHRYRRNKWDILKPPGSFRLHQSWTPTPSYLRVLSCRNERFRNCDTILRDDVFPYFSLEIKAFGNAVMPVIAEHLFRCILEDYSLNRIS